MKCLKCGSETSRDSLYCQKCGAAPAKNTPLNPPETTRVFGEDPSFFFSPGDDFGSRYKIIEEIGRGGMGRIFKAEDRDLHTVAALKMIRPEFLADERMVERFKKEILLTREIVHENVVRINDFGEINGVKFISMQYIEGKNLKKMIEETAPIPFETIAAIAKKICCGLIAAHKKGIVHRDLKPHNIMIDKDDNVYITDFGLAVSAADRESSQIGMMVGTPEYIAPEQWLGNKVDKRADIYTLGIIMYEMITGRRPFIADSDLGYYHQHLKEKAVFPAAARTKVPAYFKKIVLKCLEKKCEYRYQDAAELLADISQGTFSKDTTLRRLRKSRFLYKISAALLIACACYGIYKLGGSFIKKTPPLSRGKNISAAVLAFRDLAGGNDLKRRQLMLSYLFSVDLDQSRFVRVLPEDRLQKILKKIIPGNDGLYTAGELAVIAAAAKVDFIIIGTFIQAGDKLRLTAEAWDTLRQQWTGKVTADSEENTIFNAIDSLTLGIKKKLNLSDGELFMDKEIDRAVETVTTASAEALRFYLEGHQEFYKEKYEKAIRCFELAVNEDAAFAMAYKEMAWSYACIGNMDKRREYFEKALEHSKSLPEKEKLLIEGYYYSDYEETFAKAKAAFKKLLDIYPEDSEANMRLGFLYFISEEWEKACAYYKKAADNINPDPQPYALLAWVYMAEGMYEPARQTIDNYHKVFPGKKLLLGLKSDSYIIQGNYKLAAAALREIEKISGPDKMRQGELLSFTGDLKGAEKKFIECSKIMPGKPPQNADLSDIELLNNLRHLYLLQGRVDESLNLLEENIRLVKNFDYKLTLVFELAQLYLRLDRPGAALLEIEKNMKPGDSGIRPFYKQMRLFYMSLAYLQSGQFQEMDAALARLKTEVDRGVLKKNIKYYYLIKGMSERKNKNYKQAIDYLKKAISYLPQQIRKDFYFSQQAAFLYELAITYLEAGDPGNARERFEQVIAMTFGRRYFGDLYVESHYYSGKIYREKGSKKKAKKAYAAFLDLLQDSDSGWLEKEKQAAREYLKKVDK